MFHVYQAYILSLVFPLVPYYIQLVLNSCKEVERCQNDLVLKTTWRVRQTASMKEDRNSLRMPFIRHNTPNIFVFPYAVVNYPNRVKTIVSKASQKGK